MKTKTFDSPKKECMEGISKYLSDKEKVNIQRETESMIKFKRGSFWSLSTSSDTASIVVNVDFEEKDGKTDVKVKPDVNYIVLEIAVNIIITAIAFSIIIGICSWFFRDFSYTLYLNGQISYDAYVRLFDMGRIIPLILFIGMIAVFIVSPIESCYKKIKGTNLMARDMFLRLSSMRKEKEKQPVQEVVKQVTEKHTIKERVRVTYVLPDNCTNCSAPLKYGNVKMLDFNKAECPYCSTTINLIEREF